MCTNKTRTYFPDAFCIGDVHIINILESFAFNFILKILLISIASKTSLSILSVEEFEWSFKGSNI